MHRALRSLGMVPSACLGRNDAGHCGGRQRRIVWSHVLGGAGRTPRMPAAVSARVYASMTRSSWSRASRSRSPIRRQSVAAERPDEIMSMSSAAAGTRPRLGGHRARASRPERLVRGGGVPPDPVAQQLERPGRVQLGGVASPSCSDARERTEAARASSTATHRPRGPSGRRRALRAPPRPRRLAGHQQERAVEPQAGQVAVDVVGPRARSRPRAGERCVRIAERVVDERQVPVHRRDRAGCPAAGCARAAPAPEPRVGGVAARDVRPDDRRLEPDDLVVACDRRGQLGEQLLPAGRRAAGRPPRSAP